MKSSFDRMTSSWLYKLTESIGNVVIISCLFLAFCIPVVTIGASCSALYYTVYRKYKKKSTTITKDFMHSLKDNLKNGIIIHILYTAYSAAAGFNIYFALNGLNGIKLPAWYTLVAFIPVIPVIFSLPFVYPLLSIQERCERHYYQQLHALHDFLPEVFPHLVYRDNRIRHQHRFPAGRTYHTGCCDISCSDDHREGFRRCCKS